MLKVRRAASHQLFFFGKCYFEKCGVAFDFGQNDFCLKLRDCLFSHNRLCLRLGLSPADEAKAFRFDRAAPARPPEPGPAQALSFASVTRSIFRYNDHVLRASGFALPLEFKGNKVEYSLDVGLDLKNCVCVSVSDNLFEHNFSLKLFDLGPGQSAPKGSARSPGGTFENLRKVLGDKNKVLLRANNSSVRVQRNCFANNHGVLLLVRQKLQAEEERNVFGAPRKAGFKRLSKRSQVINSKPSQKARKDSASPEEPPEPQFRFKNRFNESVKRQIDPAQVRKKIPVHTVLRPPPKKRERTLRESRRPLNKQWSYLTLVERQTSYVDSRWAGGLTSSATRYKSSSLLSVGQPRPRKESCFRKLLQFFSPKSPRVGATHMSSFRLSEKKFFPEVKVRGNEFLENQAVCLTLAKSLRNSTVTVAKNHFFGNLFNLKCLARGNSRPLEVLGNTFEIPRNQRNKTVYVSKRFANLRFSDNEFVVIEPLEDDSGVAANFFSWNLKNRSQGFSSAV